MRPVFGWAIVGTVVLLLALFFWGPSSGGGHSSKKTFALSSMKQVGLGLIMYVEDSNQVYPPCDTWCDEVLPYVKNVAAFVSRFDERTVLSPAMNGLLDMGVIRKTADLAEVVTLFQVVGPSRNAWGGPSGAWEGYGDKRTVHTAFADGHVRSIQRQKLSGLQWRP